MGEVEVSLMKQEIPEQFCLDGSTYEQKLYDEAIE